MIMPVTAEQLPLFFVAPVTAMGHRRRFWGCGEEMVDHDHMWTCAKTPGMGQKGRGKTYGQDLDGQLEGMQQRTRA